MEEKEIMNNKEVMDTVVEAAANALEESEAKTCKCLKTAVGVGAVILAGFVIYKYVAKPAISKLKEKHEHKADEAAKDNRPSEVDDDFDDDDDDVDSESDIEE